MDKLNNFKQNPVKKLQYITKVRIVNRKPKLNDWIGFSPKTKLRNGVHDFVNWYKTYYLK